MSDNNYMGNCTTIIKTLLIMFAGWCLGALASKGLNLPLNEYQLAEVLFMLLGLVFSYVDARYPNTFGFLRNSPVQDCFIEVDESDLINPDYYEEEE